MESGITIMLVNGDRYMLNMSSPLAADESANRILSQYPQDACVEFVNPEYSDFSNEYPR